MQLYSRNYFLNDCSMIYLKNWNCMFFYQEQQNQCLYTSQHSTPLTFRSALTILKYSARINKSCKNNLLLWNFVPLKCAKTIFIKTSKVLAFLIQNFIGIKIPVKKVVLIIIKTKDFLRIILKKDFLVKVLHVELKITPKKKYCKIP